MISKVHIPPLTLDGVTFFISYKKRKCVCKISTYSIFGLYIGEINSYISLARYPIFCVFNLVLYYKPKQGNKFDLI